MIERVCTVCGNKYKVDNEDNYPLCHECYTTLFDTIKTLKDKIEYLQKLDN